MQVLKSLGGEPIDEAIQDGSRDRGDLVDLGNAGLEAADEQLPQVVPLPVSPAMKAENWKNPLGVPQPLVVTPTSPFASDGRTP